MSNNPLQTLCEKLQAAFGGSLKYYGEGIRSLNTGLAANYVTINESESCAINDAFLETIFLVRESADAQEITGSGNNLKLTRNIVFTLAANTQLIQDEYTIVNIINSIPRLEYNSSSFDQEAVANTFFGIEERNTNSAFFTISFSYLETIVCNRCN